MFEVQVATSVHWLTRNNFLITTTDTISIYNLQGWICDLDIEIAGFIINSDIWEDNLLVCNDVGTLYWIKLSEDYFEK